MRNLLQELFCYTEELQDNFGGWKPFVLCTGYESHAAHPERTRSEDTLSIVCETVTQAGRKVCNFSASALPSVATSQVGLLQTQILKRCSAGVIMARTRMLFQKQRYILPAVHD